MAMSVECCSSDRLMSVDAGPSVEWISVALVLGLQIRVKPVPTSSLLSSQASTEHNCANSLELDFDLDFDRQPNCSFFRLFATSSRG